MNASELFSKLKGTTTHILNKVASNKIPDEHALVELNALQTNAATRAETSSPVYQGVVTSDKAMKSLKKYALSSKRSAKSVIFALRRNKKYFYGEFETPKTYINLMHGIELFAKGKVAKACSILEKLPINQNKYYGSTNTLLIDNNFYPVTPGRYINAASLSEKEKDSLYKDFDLISICNPLSEAKANYGKLSYKYTDENGKILTKTIEFAYDNKIAYELIKRRILANLNPETTQAISLEETVKKARTSKTTTKTVGKANIASLIKSCKTVCDYYFGAYQPKEKKSFWQKIKENRKAKKLNNETKATKPATIIDPKVVSSKNPKEQPAPSEIKTTTGENVTLSDPEQTTTTEDDPHNIKKIAELMKKHHNLIKSEGNSEQSM